MINKNKIIQISSIETGDIYNKGLIVTGITLNANVCYVVGFVCYFEKGKEMVYENILYPENPSDHIYFPYEINPISFSNRKFVDKKGVKIDEFIKSGEEMILNPSIDKDEKQYFVSNLVAGKMKDSFILSLWKQGCILRKRGNSWQ